jgi:HK97 family phage major capsid protein
VTRAAADAEPEISIALSSDTPIERENWFGDRFVEILDHSAGAIDMSRAKQGLPLLLNHDTDEQVGRIEKLKVGDDGVLRGVVRFSRSALGQEVRQDVLDGIRVETSIGYDIQDRKEEQPKGEILKITAIRWMPMEGSLVPVPADVTVGVGRDRTVIPTPTHEARTMDTPTVTPAPAAPAVTGGEDRERAERLRVRAITQLAREHKIEPAISDKWIEDGVSADAVGRAILETVKARAAENQVRTQSMEGMGVSGGERKNYSLRRLILGMADGEGSVAYKDAQFEREVHEQLVKRARGADGTSAYTPKGLMVPIDVPLEKRAGLDSKTTTAGLELKFIEPGSLIELLRNSTKVIGLGATFMPGMQGNVAFPRQTGGGTFAWVAENPGSDVADSNLALDQVVVSPKLGQSTSSYSRNLLTQAVVDVEQLVRNDLALITAIAIDLAAINGLGSSNQPKGILSQTGVGSVAIGANGGTISWNNLVDVVKTVEAANALRGRLAWLTTPGQRAQMSKIAQISAATGIPVWWQGQVYGYEAQASTNVPSNLTKGTSTTVCHAILFGNWAELLIPQWNAFDIIVDPYRLKKQGMIEVTSYVSVDVALRHGPSFCAVTDAL